RRLCTKPPPAARSGPRHFSSSTAPRSILTNRRTTARRSAGRRRAARGAAHGDKTAVVRLLSRYSREVPALCYAGYVDRVRELVAEDPQRARVVSRDGHTPLWWLPDDEIG